MYLEIKHLNFAEGQRFGCIVGVQQAKLRIVSCAKPPDDDAVRSRRVFARRSCSAKYHDHELATASAFARMKQVATKESSGMGREIAVSY